MCALASGGLKGRGMSAQPWTSPHSVGFSVCVGFETPKIKASETIPLHLTLKLKSKGQSHLSPFLKKKKSETFSRSTTEALTEAIAVFVSPKFNLCIAR
jgi:hypothetical protein